MPWRGVSRGAACTTANVLDTHSRVAVIRGPDLRSTRSPGVFRKVPLVQDTADVRPRNSHLPVQREGPAGLQEVQSGVLVQRSFRCGCQRDRVPGRGDRFRSDLRPGRANRSPSQGFPASGQGRTCPLRGSELGPEAVGGLGPALWTSAEGRRRHVKDAARPRDAPAAPPPGLSAQTVTRFPSYNRLWQSAQDAELTVFAAVRAQLGGVRHTRSVARPSPPPAVPSGTSSQTDAPPHSALRPGPRAPPSRGRLTSPRTTSSVCRERRSPLPFERGRVFECVNVPHSVYSSVAGPWGCSPLASVDDAAVNIGAQMLLSVTSWADPDVRPWIPPFPFLFA